MLCPAHEVPSQLRMRASRHESLRYRHSSARVWLFALCLACVAWGCQKRERGPDLESQSGDESTHAEFGALIARLSEPGGNFGRPAPISNERNFTLPLPELSQRANEGGVFVGVGPEQNLTFIAAMNPTLAFVVDIRRDNMLLHLLFRSMFIEARTADEWLRLCLGRELPKRSNASQPEAPVPASATAGGAEALIRNINSAVPNPQVHAGLLARTLTRMRDEWQVPLEAGDESALARMLHAFFEHGLNLRDGRHKTSKPTFEALLRSTDSNGVERHFLADPNAFERVRQLELAGRIVPLVGDFAGEKTFAGLAAHLNQQSLRVSAVYASNVEEFLSSESLPRWRRNLSGLPHSPDAVLIRTMRDRNELRLVWLWHTDLINALDSSPRPDNSAEEHSPPSVTNAGQTQLANAHSQ